MKTPRVEPLALEDRDVLAEELLQGVRRPNGEDLNLFATLVRHPKLFRKWLPFGGALLYRGVLAARDRELLILRTAWRCGAVYEWRHHVEIAEQIGMTPEEIEAITVVDAEGHGWTDLESALLLAVDELHDGSSVSDRTWARLATSLDDAALIELCLLVGHYHTVAFAVNSLGIQPER